VALAGVHIAAEPAAARPVLEALVTRSRDVDPSVRRALYKRLSELHGGYEMLSYEMREAVLLDGLRDRCVTHKSYGCEPMSLANGGWRPNVS